MAMVPQRETWRYFKSEPTRLLPENLPTNEGNDPARSWKYPAAVVGGLFAIIAALIALGFYYGAP